MSEPTGLKRMNRTQMQIDGDESKHLPQARDAINGILTDATNQVASGQFWASLPHENDPATIRARLLRNFDEAKKARARQ
jgi:hypothetical protein